MAAVRATADAMPSPEARKASRAAERRLSSRALSVAGGGIVYYREARAKLQFSGRLPTILLQLWSPCALPRKAKVRAPVDRYCVWFDAIFRGRDRSPVLRVALLAVLSAGLPGAAGAQEAVPGIAWGTPLAEVRQGRQLGPEAGDRGPAQDERNVERFGFPLDALGEAEI